MYNVFDSGKEFTENLELLRAVVIKAEKEAKVDFMEIEEFFSKLKRCYKSLNDEQKILLRAKDFIQSTGKLLEKASQSKIGQKMDIGTGSASVVIDNVSAGPWWELIQGLNILINVGFLGIEINRFHELYNLKNSWKTGGNDKVEVMKNSKFENEFKMRNLIIEIRDTMMSNGY